jgi:hypothetical protein
MLLSPVQIATLTSAGLGAIGTIAIFYGSITMEPLSQGPFAEAAVEWNAQILARNRIRVRFQLFGLILLMLAFLTQGLSVFVT